MNTPHLGLMKTYATTPVFFEKAAGAERLMDRVGRLYTPGLMDKIAQGPAALLPKKPLPFQGATPKMAPPVPAMQTPITNSLPGPAKPSTPSKPPKPMGVLNATASLPQMPAGQAGRLAAPNVQDFKPGLVSRAGDAVGGVVDKAKGALGKAAPVAEAAAKAKGGLPWNRMLLTGGALGAGYLGLKALQSGLGFMGGGHGGPANYGSAPGGYSPPMGVNGYGQPQLGTQLM